MAQVEYPNQITLELAELILKHGQTELGTRFQNLIGKSKKEIVAEFEQIVSEIKTGDVVTDNATKQTIKYVYRQLTS